MTAPDTPYAPPSVDAAPPRAPVAKDRTPGLRAVRVLGVLSIVFATLTLASMALNLVWSDPTGAAIREAVSRSKGSASWKQIEAVASRLGTANAVGYAVFLSMSPLLLFLGIGLVCRASWTRVPTIVWAVAALVLTGVLAVIQAAVQAPGVAYLVELYRKTSPTGVLPVAQDFQLRFMVGYLRHWWISVLFNAAYPAVLLILMSRRSAKSALGVQQ